MPKEYSWRRLFWYYTGYYDDYPTDQPKEEDVKKKQVLMKQVGLSKLKMNKVIIEPSIPFDLQKIPENIKPIKIKKQTDEKTGIKPPPSSPINMSQKQKEHKISYADKLKILKNI